MSQIKLSPSASGTGIFTIESPASNTNRTISLPDATGTIITTAGGAAISGTTGSFSGDLSFNSGYGSAAVAYGCRAWVNFNGTSTVAIRASGNVTSITDNGTGDYTMNFTTAMPDANYCVCGTTGTTFKGVTFTAPSPSAAFTTSSCRINASTPASDFDMATISVAVFR